MTKQKQYLWSELTSGSPNAGEPVFLVIGKLRRPHGLKGDVLLDVWTDFPERLKPGVVIYLGDDHKALEIRSLRKIGQSFLIAFTGYSDRESVDLFRNQYLYVRSDDRPPLPDGEYYHHQLFGMQVNTEEGRTLGRLVQILETGANDVYIIKTESDQELLIPAIDSVVLDIDTSLNIMIVRLLPGLERD